MGKHFKAGATPFADAAAYLAGGRNPRDRPIANNTRLRRIDDDTIAVVFHDTAVVTYHADGMMTIYGGGWDSMSTRRRIAEYSPMRLSTSGGQWIIGWTGEHTEPKIAKCRTCKHRGRWMETRYCHGPRQWGPTWCHGGTTVHDVALDAHLSNFDAYLASARVVACEHGHELDHATVACEHGHLDTTAHAVGEYEIVCGRCDGTGMADYGSKAIPILTDAYTPFVINADGSLAGETHLVPDNGGHGGPLPVYKPKPAPEPEYSYGSEVETRLSSALPGLATVVANPAVLGGDNTIAAVIINLNDVQGWSRERIADWLDTLDADLRFTTAA